MSDKKDQDQRRPTTGTEARLQAQRRRSTAGLRDCCLVSPETAHQHGHEDDGGIPGLEDTIAAAALKARELNREGT